MSAGLGQSDDQVAQGVALAFLATFAAGAAVGYFLPRLFAAKSNPAHENFIGRRVELRGQRFGTVRRVHDDMLVVKMDRSGVRHLVHVRKDRVTLI